MGRFYEREMNDNKKLGMINFRIIINILNIFHKCDKRTKIVAASKIK